MENRSSVFIPASPYTEDNFKQKKKEQTHFKNTSPKQTAEYTLVLHTLAIEYKYILQKACLSDDCRRY